MATYFFFPLFFVQAASHGNTDARDRLEALAKSASNVLSRDDHESRIDTKLVRKRTQAQVRSEQEQQRQQQASRPSYASLPSLPPPQGRSNSPSLGPGGYWPSNNGGPSPGTDPRPSSAQGQQGARRRDALTQVEAAAAQGPQPTRRGALTQVEAAALVHWTPHDPQPQRLREPPPQSSVAASLRSYQLSDGPSPAYSNPNPPRGGSTASSSAGSVRPVRSQDSSPAPGPGRAEIPMQQKRPETFAEMVRFVLPKSVEFAVPSRSC